MKTGKDCGLPRPASNYSRRKWNPPSTLMTSPVEKGKWPSSTAFTEHGALMAKAVKMSVALIEAFVRLRQEFTTTQALARRLAEIEKTVMTHDQALVKLFAVIKPLLSPPPEPPRKKIGFHP